MVLLSMSFVIVAYFLLVIAAVAAMAAVVGLVDFIAEHHRARRARRQSVLTYFRGLVAGTL